MEAILLGLFISEIYIGKKAKLNNNNALTFWAINNQAVVSGFPKCSVAQILILIKADSLHVPQQGWIGHTQGNVGENKEQIFQLLSSVQSSAIIQRLTET